MAPKAPGMHNRKRLALKMVMDMYSGNEAERKWFENGHRLDGPFCPKAALSSSSIQSSTAR